MSKFHHLSIGFFVLWLASGFAGMISGLDAKLFAQEERRLPVAFPVLATSPVASRTFLASLENWFADRVYARQQYLTLYHTLGLQESYGLRDSPSVFGRNGWLFLGNAHSNVLDYTINKHAVTPQAVQLRVSEIKALAEACKKRNVPFVLLVAPNKHTIYSENLPGWLVVKSDRRLADAVLEQARAEGLPFLFPKAALLAKKTELAPQGKHVYYKDDSHWNSFGAFVGYEALREELARQNYALPSLSHMTLHPSHAEREGDIIPLGRYSRRHWGAEDYETLFATNNEGEKTHDKLLVVGDSFFGHLRPMLNAAFADVKELHLLEDRGRFLEALDTYKPNVVICVVVERNYVAYKELFPDMPKL